MALGRRRAAAARAAPRRSSRSVLLCPAAAAVMSSNGEHGTVLRGVTHGACDFLIKPVRIEELRNIWQHVVRRQKSLVGGAGSGARRGPAAVLQEPPRPHAHFRVLRGLDSVRPAQPDSGARDAAYQLHPPRTPAAAQSYSERDGDGDGTMDSDTNSRKRKEGGRMDSSSAGEVRPGRRGWPALREGRAAATPAV